MKIGSSYPEAIERLAFAPKLAGEVAGPDAAGVDANFRCGSTVRFTMRIDAETNLITDIRFRTGGCGFMIAAAESLAGSILGSRLPDLHGGVDANRAVETELGRVTPDRTECVSAAANALRAAFADLRRRRIEEFAGEKALICTCFGITEEMIERCGATTVEEVGDLTNAGTGCGSCRMLIEELIGPIAEIDML